MSSEGRIFVLIEVAAELGVLGILVAVLLRVRRLAFWVLAELHARRLAVVVIVVVHIQLRRPLLRRRPQAEVQIEEPVGVSMSSKFLTSVVRVSRTTPRSPSPVCSSACSIQARRRHPHLMTPQHLHKIVDYRVHCALVRVLVGRAVHLVHRFVRVLAGWLFLAEVFALGAPPTLRSTFLGVAVVLDDDAESPR